MQVCGRSFPVLWGICVVLWSMTSRRLMDCPKNKKSAPFCGCPNRKQCCCRGLLFVPPLAFVDCLLACSFVRSPSSLSLSLSVYVCMYVLSIELRCAPRAQYISHTDSPHTTEQHEARLVPFWVYTHTHSHRATKAEAAPTRRPHGW